jgi:hypothetical protein
MDEAWVDEAWMDEAWMDEARMDEARMVEARLIHVLRHVYADALTSASIMWRCTAAPPAAQSPVHRPVS